MALLSSDFSPTEITIIAVFISLLLNGLNFAIGSLMSVKWSLPAIEKDS